MQILGFHFDRPYMRWAILENKRIKSLKSFIPNSVDDVKQLYIEQTGKTATGISSLVRHLEFKISSTKKIEQGLPFQIESLTHLDLNDLVYAAEVQSQKAVVFLTSKENLKTQLQEWKAFSLEPDLVTAIPQALLRFAEARCPDLKDAYLVDLGSEEWTCVWIEEGVKKAFTIEGGIESLLSALWEDRKKVLFPNEVNSVAKQIDLLQLKSHLNPQLSLRLNEFRNTLASTLFSFQPSGEPKPVFFTGRIEAFGHFRQFLLEAMPEYSLYEPPMHLGLDESKCAIAIGTALECSSPKVQFLTKEFVPTKQWRKMGVFGTSLIAASLFLSVLLLIGGMLRFKDQKKIMADSLKNTVEQLNGKDSFQDMESAFQMIQKNNKETIYLSEAPTVSEVLRWISTQSSIEDCIRQ